MTDTGRVFRQAWIDGVRAHYPGDPKPGYVVAWSETPQWERESASAVGDLVLGLLKACDGAAVRLSRTQKGQFVVVSWAAQIWMRIPDPKPSYVAQWRDLPP